MPGCGSGAFASSYDLLFGSHAGRLQAENPLSSLSRFAEPPLRDLIVELDRSPKLDANVQIFVVSYNRALFLASGNRTTRLAHALSMARKDIGADTYAVVRAIFRNDATA